MNKLGVIITVIYLFITGVTFVSELYYRIYKTSALAGLFTFMLTTPSSFFIDWLSTTLFGIAVDSSDAAFVTILFLSMILNALIIYLIVSFINFLVRS